MHNPRARLPTHDRNPAKFQIRLSLSLMANCRLACGLTHHAVCMSAATAAVHPIAQHVTQVACSSQRTSSPQALARCFPTQMYSPFLIPTTAVPTAGQRPAANVHTAASSLIQCIATPSTCAKHRSPSGGKNCSPLQNHSTSCTASSHIVLLHRGSHRQKCCSQNHQAPIARQSLPHRHQRQNLRLQRPQQGTERASRQPGPAATRSHQKHKEGTTKIFIKGAAPR